MFNFFKRLFKKGKGKDNGRRLFVVGNDYPCYKDPEMPVEIKILNPLQSCFRDKYRPDKNCIIDAGTGEGKTLVTYVAARYFLDVGKKIMMLAPSVALVNDLFRRTAKTYGDKIVCRCTGGDVDPAIDRKYFIIATPEKYLAEVRAGKAWVQDVGLVILDEAHKLYDNERGGNFDTALTIAMDLYEAKVLIMSGTLPDKERVIEYFDADCFVCGYESIKLRFEEKIVIDDFNAKEIEQKKKSEYVYNKNSARLALLKTLLEQHKEDSVLVFVTTKTAGFCLQTALNIPFHCRDISTDEKKKIISQFNSGELKTLIATDTLSEGVDTPCDVVIIFGGRRGGGYLDYFSRRQKGGRIRAKEGRTDAPVYVLGDRVELFNSKRQLIAKSLPLPVETMLLTLFSVKPSTKADLCAILGRTLASTFWTMQKIGEEVDRCLRLLFACKLLAQSGAIYALTPEGIILAKYMIPPIAYIRYIKAARKLETVRMSDPILANKIKTEIQEATGGVPNDIETALTAEKWVKGLLLLGVVYSEGKKYAPTGIQTYFMEFNTRLARIGFNTDLGLDCNSLAKWAAQLKHYSLHPSAIPSYLQWNLKDLNMWIFMMREMEKHNIIKPMPGKEAMHTAMKALQVACAKAEAGKKKNVKTLPLFASQIKPLTEAAVEDQKKAAA